MFDYIQGGKMMVNMVNKIVFCFFIMFFLLLFSTNFSLAQVPNLVARWDLDEADGKKVTDFVGKNHGEFVGKPVRVNAKFGKGVQFQGGNSSYIEVPMSDDLQLDKSITWMLWANVTSSGGRQELFCYGDAYVIHVADGVFKAYIHQGGQFPRAPGKTPVEINKWHFLAATYDADTLKFYLDGKLDGSARLPGAIGFLGLPLRFGNNPAAPAESWGIMGVIDEIQIWDKPMTEAQILHAYEFPLDFLAVNSKDKLTGYWGEIKKY